MESPLIVKVADNIISPLGRNSQENFLKLLSSERDLCSELKQRPGAFGLPETFCGSLLERDEVTRDFEQDCGVPSEYTLFEQLCILCIDGALKKAELDPTRDDVLLVLSTTKGNVDQLEKNVHSEDAYISRSAEKIAGFFGMVNTPVISSNACISGVCAQIDAVRALKSGKYRHAIVVGADILSKFIVSGFQSFKALSPNPCKPYDKDRCGLNLGEAAGTIILSRIDNRELIQDNSWRFIACSNHNDANHISGPSRTGEGSYRVLTDILKHVKAEDLAFINAHGTATAYNDEMESIAIHRAGLDEVPVNGLKGFYGHTLGAAGIIETIISMLAVENGYILPTRGYLNQGTTYRLNISNKARHTDKKCFIKILSGFGGSNAGIAYEKGGDL